MPSKRMPVTVCVASAKRRLQSSRTSAVDPSAENTSFSTFLWVILLSYSALSCNNACSSLRCLPQTCQAALSAALPSFLDPDVQTGGDLSVAPRPVGGVPKSG